MIEGLNNPRDERGKLSGWAFIGVLGVGKAERQVPIGVYAQYRDGSASANAWLKSTKDAVRWEAEKIYEDYDA